MRPGGRRTMARRLSWAILILWAALVAHGWWVAWSTDFALVRAVIEQISDLG